jgi:hypothetical protein
MKSYSAVVALASFVSAVAAHGFITEPSPRMPGDGLKANCGDQVFNTQSSDRYGNVQGSIQNLQGSHPDCKIWQCKGVPFADAGDIHDFSAGQKIPMKVEIRAPHDGVANVSIVKVSSDTVIGSPLISWDEYALTSSPLDKHPDWTSFDITMPDVSTECAKAGDCVIQWYWDAPKIDQVRKILQHATIVLRNSNCHRHMSLASTSRWAVALQAQDLLHLQPLHPLRCLLLLPLRLRLPNLPLLLPPPSLLLPPQLRSRLLLRPPLPPVAAQDLTLVLASLRHSPSTHSLRG